MLKKCFSLASAASLAGAVAWVSASTACGGTENGTPVTPDSGASSSGDASASSSSSSSSSSGSSSGGAGTNPIIGKDPATVEGETVQYGKCEKFEKCPEDIKGQWKLSGGCLPDNTFDQYKQFCAGLTVHDVTIKVKGTVGIDATKVARDSSIFVNAQVDIDKSNCAGLALAGDCKSLGNLLKAGQGGAKFDEVECNETTAACFCTAQVTITEKTDDTYELDGSGTLTTKGTAERTYDYCSKGATAMYQETTAKNPTFGMFVQLKK